MRLTSAVASVALGLCGVTFAQTALPRFYPFQRFDSVDQVRAQPIGFTSDPRMTAMVTINVGSGSWDHDPVRVADKVMDFIRARLANPSLGLLDPGDIAISLIGFAHEHYSDEPTAASLTSLRDPADPLVPRTGQVFTWPPGFAVPVGSTNWWEFMLIHPWMDVSRVRLRQWTEAFMARIMLRHTRDGIPLPRRWVLDTEQPLFNCCDQAWSHFLANVMKDARWGTRPVAGFSPPRTMAQLLTEANAEFGWNLLTGDGTALNPGFSTSAGGPQEVANRPLAHWFMRTNSRIRSAILAETAYGPIRAAYAAYRAQHPGEQIPIPIVSNYGEYATDGQWDTVGWHEDRIARVDEATGAQLVEDSRYDVQSRAAMRTMVDLNSEGARQGHTMIINWFGSPYAQARWTSIPTMTWSDRDSVPLYDCRVIPEPFYSFSQRDLYRPGLPAETVNQTCVRIHRRRLEAVLNSETPGHTPAPFPYILFTGETGNFEIVADDDLTVSLLSMLRAKGVTEIVPFTDDIPGPNLSGWLAVQSAYRRVWAFQLSACRWAIADQPAGTIGTAADLQDTLRVTSQGDRVDATTSALAVYSGTTSRTQLEATFSPLLGVRTDALRINLECQVTPGPFLPYASLLTEGEVWLWDFTQAPSGAWRRLHIGEGLTDPARYRFVTPDLSTRRTFDVQNASRFIGTNGKVHVMLRHVAPAEFSDDRFESRYDLVQVIALNDLGQMPSVSKGIAGRTGNCPTCVSIDPVTEQEAEPEPPLLKPPAARGVTGVR